MTGHEQAREWVGARRDGALAAADAAALDAHLAGCASCAAYAAQLAGLGDLVAALPREHAPATLPARVAARIRSARRRRIAWRLVPAFGVVAVATAVALVVVSSPVPGPFPFVPPAAAAPLLRLRTLYVEREIVARREDGTVRTTTREKVWFRAPGDVRIERRVVRDGRATEEVVVTTPGVRWDGRTVVRGQPPEIGLPEPITPTIALLGDDDGPGPAVAGRPTRRWVLELGGERRVALVDAAFGGVLSGDEQIVLEKSEQGGIRERPGVRKRTLVVRYDEPMADDLFAVPSGAGLDGGFRTVSPGRLASRPRRVPEGFALVRAATDGDEEALLYARGALPILVTTLDSGSGPKPSYGVRRSVDVGGRPGELELDLYALPRVTFPYGGRQVSVVAPLPPDELVRLATEMFPA